MICEVKKDYKPFWKYINFQNTDQQGILPFKTSTEKLAETDE